MNDDLAAAERFRNRAEELRAIADSTKDREMRRILSEVAADYDRKARSLLKIAESERALANEKESKRK